MWRSGQSGCGGCVSPCRSSPTLTSRSGLDGVSERRRRSDMMVQDPDLFMLVAAMTCGPELAPESCFADEIREKLLNPV